MISTCTRPIIAIAVAALTGVSCARATTTPTSGSTGGGGQTTPPPALKTVLPFLVGAAMNANQYEGRDAAGVAIVKTHYNTITPENVLKWQSVHPQPGTYDFTSADRFVDFGTGNGMVVIGHTLVWHNQTPSWVFQNASGQPLTRDELLARMHDHIQTVVGRYKGRIKGWDVVNEALNEDGTMRASPWRNIIGDEYVEKAFQFAHEADPDAELYYNDYSLENAPKRDGAVALIRRLQQAGVPVKAIGLQGHDRLDWPTVAQQEAAINAFAALGIKVNITELDIDVLPQASANRSADVTLSAQMRDDLNPYVNGLPEAVQTALANRYADLFRVFVAHRDVISRVTFWGVSDGDSWLNDWPIRGRTNYPLLFDRQHQPKPAFDAVVRVAK